MLCVTAKLSNGVIVVQSTVSPRRRLPFVTGLASYYAVGLFHENNCSSPIQKLLTLHSPPLRAALIRPLETSKKMVV
jgi:hypothetical protein